MKGKILSVPAHILSTVSRWSNCSGSPFNSFKKTGYLDVRPLMEYVCGDEWPLISGGITCTWR